MALLHPHSKFAGVKVTQPFGGKYFREEPGWISADRRKASRSSFTGGTYQVDLHDAIDYSGTGINGTPIVASEKGTVTFAGVYAYTVGGVTYRPIMVRVRIRTGVTYESWHLSKLATGIVVGAKVYRGQTLGYVGSTGNSTGPHNHFELKLTSSSGRVYSWDAALFLPGGALADDPRILPLPDRYVAVNGAGINVRNAPSLTAPIYGTTKADGIYSGGVLLAPLGPHLFSRFVEGSGIEWAMMYVNKAWRYCSKPLIHFVP